MYVFIIGLIIQSVHSLGITLTQYPSSTVYLESDQIISWKSPIHLDQVTIDLYQHSNKLQTLGQTNQQVSQFKWHVSDESALGGDFFVRVTGISNMNGTAWVNSPAFSIALNHSQRVGMYVILGIFALLVILGCLYCSRKKQYRHVEYTSPFVSNTVAGMPPSVCVPPPMNPVANTPVVHATPIYTGGNNGYSRSTVAGAAAAGVMGGIILDEAMHSGRHHHHTIDFGGGTFGGGDFGGQAGDSSGFGGGDFGGGDFGGQAGDSSGFS